ncbi:MAG: alpha/beta hydrolase [Anaerolineae bacterium]|nr:alpha/beta hydrolase [Anaerolineae bacterium]
MSDNQIRLPDGRALGYAEYGDPAGKPVLFFTGAPSSRFLHPPTEPTKALGARLIVLERPGFGLSDFQPRRTLLDWPNDVAAAADALGLDRFAVAGISAGAPYAAACAYKIPQRLTHVAIISGVGPMDLPGAIEEMPQVRQLGTKVARNAPWLLRPVLWLVSNPHRAPERFYEHMLSGNSDADRALLSRPEMKAMLMRNYLEATRAGIRGFARESIIASNPWGFSPADITVPVYLWHGEDDANVSLSAAQHLAETIPNCQTTFLPGEGHWLILEHWEEILTALIS